MTITRPLLALVGALCLASSVTAQNFTDAEVTTIGSFPVEDLQFNTDRFDNGFSTNTLTVGLDQIEIDLGGGNTVTAWDLCAEFYVSPNTGGDFSLTSGFGPLSSKASLIGALISNALPIFQTSFGMSGVPAQDETKAIGAAIQIALWEIIEERNSTLSPETGNFRTDPTYASIDTNAPRALELADMYISFLNDGTWMDQGGYNYYYADQAEGSTPYQDRLWFTTSDVMIPEPSVPLLGLLGAGLLLRRRRA